MNPAAVDALAAEQHRSHARELKDAGELVAAEEALEQAAALWRGEPLAGVPGPYAEAERARLGSLHWSMLEERADIALALGRHAEIAAELTALVNREPLRERLVGVAMTALYRADRQADALDMFRHVRATLAEELGVDPGPGLAGLYEQILRNDPALGAPCTDTGKPVPPADCPTGLLPPAQLPHDVAGFTGREAELAWLRGLISANVDATADDGKRSSSVVISAIDGCGGIGKTALAVRLAHQVAPEFPDGQLCLDLRGFDPQLPPLNPAEALARLLHGLGGDAESTPGELDVQAARYRSLVAGKRMLILLDNAVSTEQVRDLLPGTPGCLVLVTSRNRLGGLVARHGARRLTLDVLSKADALSLLQLMVGKDRAAAEPEALSELAELCGRFPLALRIAAERVAGRGSDPMAALVEELRRERDRLEVLSSDEDESSAMRSVFSWSYQSLKSEAARLFRLLSVHAGPEISAQAAAAIAGTSLDEARRLLRNLSDGHLLEDASYQRFRFHDLLRVYASERAHHEDSETERRQAVRRMLDHFLYTAANANGLIAPNIPLTELEPAPPDVQAVAMRDVDDALDWLDREQNTLVGAVRQAATVQEHRVAWQLMERLRELFQMHRTTTEWVETLTVGVDCARRAGDKNGRAALLNQRGYARIRSCEYDAALEDLNRARSIYTELGDARRAARALGNIANVYLDGLRDQERALSCFAEAGDLLGAAGDLDGQARAMGGIGRIHASNGRYDEALEHERRVLQIFNDLGDTVEMRRTKSGIAGHEMRAGRPDVAMPLLLEALEDLRRIGDQFNVGTCLSDLARCYRELGHLESAVKCAEEAVALLRPRDPGPLGDALLELGRSQRGLGRLEDARRTLTDAIEFADAGDEKHLGLLHVELAALGATATASG